MFCGFLLLLLCVLVFCLFLFLISGSILVTWGRGDIWYSLTLPCPFTKVCDKDPLMAKRFSESLQGQNPGFLECGLGPESWVLAFNIALYFPSFPWVGAPGPSRGLPLRLYVPTCGGLGWALWESCSHSCSSFWRVLSFFPRFLCNISCAKC